MFFPPQDPENVTLSDPLKLPAACGENVTFKLVDCGGDKVTARLGPAKMKPVPEATACEIVRVDFPVLLTATGTVALLPIWILPKLTLVVDIAI